MGESERHTTVSWILLLMEHQIPTKPKLKVSVYTSKLGSTGTKYLWCVCCDPTSLGIFPHYSIEYLIFFAFVMYLVTHYKDLFNSFIRMFPDGIPIDTCLICSFSLFKYSLLICLELIASLRSFQKRKTFLSGNKIHLESLLNIQTRIYLLAYK